MGQYRMSEANGTVTINILFLDIQMKQIDGIETAKKLRKENFKGFIIFITILKEMVFQSFEVYVGWQYFFTCYVRFLLCNDRKIFSE